MKLTVPLADRQVAKLGEGEHAVGGVAGLVLRVRNGKRTFRLRYRNAEGVMRNVNLGPYGTGPGDVSLKDARAKAGSLLTATRERVEGRRRDPVAEERAERRTGATLASVVETYVAERSPVWKASTRRTYLSAIGTFTAWAEANRIALASELTADALASFRAHAVGITRRIKAKGGGRRDVVSTDAPRSALAINCDLRAVKTMLQTLRVAGRLSSLTSSDAIRDNLRATKAEISKPRPLKPAALRKLLAACEAHDAATFETARAGREPSPKHEPIGPLVVFMLLSGARLGEALALEWSDVDLDEGEIRIRAGKTGRERAVDLSITPALAALLGRMRGSGRVFSQHSQTTVGDARRRLMADYGAPAFLWSVRNSRPGERSAPTLRSTCGCYLACAPAIFGGASVFMSAAQLGHSVQVAEKHYLGTLKRIPADAKTIETAMEIEGELARFGRVE